MAKKSVASLQTGSKRLSKAIKMVRVSKNRSYTFVEAIMDPSKVNRLFSKKISLFSEQYYTSYFLF